MRAVIQKTEIGAWECAGALERVTQVLTEIPT